LAGLECARLLARRGLKVTLADRRSRLDQGVRTTGIFVRKTLEDFALPEDCLGPPVSSVVLYSPGGRELPLESEKVEFRVGRMARLYARRLEEGLWAGVTWLPGTTYLGSEARRGGSTVFLDRSGKPEVLFSRFLIGADGAGSPVSGDLGLDKNRRFLLGLEEVHESESHGAPAFHCFLDPDLAPGYIAWIVDDGETVHLGVGGMSGAYDPHRSLAAFKARLPAHLIPQGPPVERRGGRIPAGGVLRRIACPRGLLVGDAAGAVSPLTAGGLDACLRLSHFAVELSVAFLNGGECGALLAYSGRSFRARFASRLFMRRAMEAAGFPFAMEIAHALLRTPPGRALARHVFFGRGSFPLPAPPVEPARVTG
jgi:flavin-dependent dehydrogenase